MAIDMNVFRGFAEQIKMLPQMAKPTDCPEDKRVERAKEVFAAKIDAVKATDLESCVHCGMCAEACQFYIETEDPNLTPIHKLDLLKRFYRREKAPMRFLHRLTEAEITEDDLRETQHLVYETCTECGRCGLVCPMGIDIASMVHVTRTGLAAAGLIPAGLRAVEQEQGTRGTIFGTGPDQLCQAVEELRAKGHEVHIDKEKADVLVLSTVIDIQLFKDTLEATVKVMNHLGVDWTIHTCAFEGANYEAEGYYRSEQNCLMFTRTDYFCAVCAAAIEKVIDEYTRPAAGD